METVADCTSLKQYRKRLMKGVSQGDIAQRAGLSTVRISDFERNCNVPSEHIPALAKAYGLSVEEFLRLHRREASGGADHAKSSE